MEAQDQKKILATDNHGVHLCHKCGWPFPNPHPSARHRRAHKKVCGKIEDHRLIDSEASNHSTCSDDEHVSDDDDNINPTPKIMDASKTEKGADKLEEKLKRSEDDEFADAAAEFSDGKLVGNSKNLASIGEMDESNPSRSFKDCEMSDLIQLPSTSMDESLFHLPEVASCTVDRPVAGAEDAPSQQSINIPKDIVIDRKNDSMGDLYPIESEPDGDNISGKDVISVEENVDSDSNAAVIQPKLKIEETITEISSEVAAKSCSSDHSEALPKDFEDDSGLKLEQLASADSIAGVELGEDELKARNEGSEANESFVPDRNPKEEQEFKDAPSNVSVVICAIEDAPSMEDHKETPQTKLDEIKGLGEEHLPAAAESIDELQAVSDKDDGSYRESPKTDPKYTISVSDSSANGIETTSAQSCSEENENLKRNLGLGYNESMEDKIMKEGGANSEPSQVEEEGNDNVAKPHVNPSLIDVSADSSSQTDSLEGNWGSVLSVFSARSDAQAVAENEAEPPTKNQAPAEAEKASWKIPKASSHNSDKSDVFEAPSFMTLVEPGRAAGQNLADSEVQNVEPMMLQAGWFPSFTPAMRDSDGRKKNEEIIAKVTNWSTGKEKQQDTPLRNLLGKAAMEGRPKSPKPENGPPPSIRKDEKTTIASFPARGSPARLPVEIKREKKKVKGRPYWAQLVCCTSANY